MATPENTLIAGLFLLFAGFSGLLRHFLLEPYTPNYPKAPPMLLGVFFAFSSLLVFMGLRYLNVWFNHMNSATSIPPGASPTMAMLAVALFLYKLSILVNVLRQRLPAQVWARLNAINELVRCSKAR